MILISGGAGYIGSCFAWVCRDSGRPAVILDNLSTGCRSAPPPDMPFVLGDIRDRDLVQKICREQQVHAIVHFAGSIIVEESVSHPMKYYQNNLSASLDFLEVAIGSGIRNVVFSSTAAVYGYVGESPVTEDTSKRPSSPYGWSKLFAEQALSDLAAASELEYVALRYFNVAGADSLLRSGIRSKNATHLIKVCCEVATEQRKALTIYGKDYPTADGTCVRDYIHVSDLAAAHLAALDYLESGGKSTAMNCGYGRGASVNEVVAMFEKVTGRSLSTVVGPPRSGDVASLVADNSRLVRTLGWIPRYGNLETIVRSALDWEHKTLSSS